MTDERVKSPWYWYVAAGVATLVSTDTSWRFFGERLGISDLRERVILFAVLEIALVAAGLSMRAGVRRHGSPGSARMIAWGLAGASAYMAIELSGPAAGIARVGLGPVLAIVALHQALGIEIKARIGQRTGTWAKVGRELRERALSWANLGDDDRDAKVRSRERAAVKAATIATYPKVDRKALRKAVLKSGASTDPAMRALLLDTVAALQSLDALSSVQRTSPWADEPVPAHFWDMSRLDTMDGAPVLSAKHVPSIPVQRVRPVSGGPAIGWDVAKVVRLVQEGRPSAEIQDAVAGVSAKTVQRVTRVVRAIASGKVDADIIKGDVTGPYVQTIREAMAE